MSNVKSSASDSSGNGPQVVLPDTNKGDASAEYQGAPISLDSDPSSHGDTLVSTFDHNIKLGFHFARRLRDGVVLKSYQAKQKYAEYDATVDPAEVDRMKFEAEMRKWDAHFAKYAVELKENYYDWYITLDYENGNHTIGPSRAASKAAFEEKYGVRDRAYTGHIGTA